MFFSNSATPSLHHVVSWVARHKVVLTFTLPAPAQQPLSGSLRPLLPHPPLNLPSRRFSWTSCPRCRALLIRRRPTVRRGTVSRFLPRPERCLSRPALSHPRRRFSPWAASHRSRARRSGASVSVSVNPRRGCRAASSRRESRGREGRVWAALPHRYR